MLLSRRSFLIGAGAVGVSVAAGFGALDAVDHTLIDRGLHHFGILSSPNRVFPPSGAKEQTGTLKSRYMGSTVGWTIARPAGGPPGGIIFCLHGKGENHRVAFDQINVPDAAASVGLRVVVAAVDGGADSYWHKRADGADALSMLLEEFVPLVRGLVDPLPQALMGWSMGGYGALLAAERARPDFVGVAPASPALWLTPGATAPGAFDSPSDFYAHDVFTRIAALRGLNVAVACGTGDPFYQVTKTLVAKMDYPHSEFFGPGFHDPGYWRSVAPKQLTALADGFNH